MGRPAESEGVVVVVCVEGCGSGGGWSGCVVGTEGVGVVWLGGACD